MTADEYRRARDLFEQALDADEPAALSGLEAPSRESPQVVAEVRALLAHHARAGDFMRAPLANPVQALADGPATYLPGTTLGTYVIEREIARGGMGCVYLAIDQRLGRKVAIKTLPATMTTSAAQRERLRREARAAAALTHPGICTVYALEELGEAVFIVTEYIEGRTLRDEIEAGVPDMRTLRATALELAAAMASAHDHGITHRDLKPENIMRTTSGALKVLDFGLALTEADVDAAPLTRMTLPGAFIGTPGYMAPEQLTGGPIDARTDLFALGIVLYEYATGHHPFEASHPLVQTARILDVSPEPVESRRPEIPADIAAVIGQALQKDPHRRAMSARELVEALSSSPETHAALSRPSAPRGVSTWWRTHQLVTIGMYMVGVIAMWFIKEWIGGEAEPLFFVAGIAATVAGVFRGHLLFTERWNRASFDVERRRSAPVTIGVDITLGLILLFEGLRLTSTRAVAAVVAMALGAGMILARLLLERSTTKAAFGE
ncbi:MAG: serine/threonine protein kinase [Acidobacteriaceae bacterium]|jgi:serine/threonine protein kinase|nr:serine/threonine protein kinase [Acidobacteriaceae bacterium]